MTHKSIPLLLAMIALGLSSCGNELGSSDTSITTEESLTSEIASTEESSSEDPIDTASSDEEPSETSSEDETPYNWPSDIINAYFEEYIDYDGDIGIPAPSRELDAGRSYTVRHVAWSVSKDDVIEMYASGDFTGYAEEVNETEYWETGTCNLVRYVMAQSIDYGLEIRIYGYDEEADQTMVRISIWQKEAYAVWPEDIINASLLELAGEGYSSLPYMHEGLYEPFDIETTEAGQRYFEIDIYGVDPADYGEILEEGGWLPNADATLYHDKNLDLYLTFDTSVYDEGEYELFTVRISEHI